jgi:hypothetical protein
MRETWDPVLPPDVQKNLEQRKEQAFTLYLDFIVDGTASMYTIFPAVYYAASHFLECLSKYEVYPQVGLTVIRDEKNGEETELFEFENGAYFTSEIPAFLKKLKAVSLFGGGADGKESVHTAVGKSLKKFPNAGRNRAILVFSDAYGSNDYEDYLEEPIGQAIFFTTEELSEEDFPFCFMRPDGAMDEEASAMFLSIEKLLKPMSTEFLDNIVKPLKDLTKGVSIGV